MVRCPIRKALAFDPRAPLAEGDREFRLNLLPVHDWDPQCPSKAIEYNVGRG
jgi:hypothetical protein